MKKLSVGVGVALAVLATSAPAQTVTELKPYLGLGALFNKTDDDRRSEDGYGISAGYGVPLHRYFALEGNVTYQHFDRDSAPDNLRWKEYGAEANGLLTLPLAGGWIPYFALGLGVANSDLKGAGEGVDMAYQSGIGTFYMFNSLKHTWGLQVDAKYRVVDVNDSAFSDEVGGPFEDFDDVVVKVATVLFLGKKEEPAPAPAAPAPTGPLDSDKDGVTDDKDECPETPEGVKVDEKGCPLATDMNGEDGVVEKLGTIYFDYDKTTLNPSERVKLDKAAAAFNKAKADKVEIKADGHADSRGSNEYNVGLSERRANVVKDYLVKKGVPADRVAVVAFGETKPVGDNETAQGRAQNRRVEINLVKQ